MLETWIFRLVFAAFIGVFAAKVVRRLRLIGRAPGGFPRDRPGRRVRRVVDEVLLQRKVIARRPLVGVAHALVFWGFVAFAGYTAVQFLHGLGIADLTGSRPFRLYALALVPFAVAVAVGITGLLVRRVALRPPALGATLSAESVVIGLFILALMVTFLLEFRLAEGWAASANWWVHVLVILAFLALIPDSKHLHLLFSPATIFLKSPRLATVGNLDFEKEEVGLETLAQLPPKQVLDAFTCVECGRCQEDCPARATGKALNPKTLVLDAERALLAGDLARPLAGAFAPGVLWQCTTCGACEDVCPVGVEHLPLVIGARRGLAANGEAPESLGAVFNNLERRGNIWGLGYDAREKFVSAAGLETFDPARHDWLVWLGCAGAFEADFQKSLRSLFAILRARGVTFGVLAKERCTGDLAKRTGNEYLFQELARQNIEALDSAGARRILTGCPHCLKALGDDYRAFGFEAEVVHATVLVAGLFDGVPRPSAPGEGTAVTFHDPCYLGRYGGHEREPRLLLRRFGAVVREPARAGRNPFCCGAGGGLLFDEHEEGTRISGERFGQLRATGAATIVTACPFCTIMLKSAQASAGADAADTSVVDVMTFVSDRMEGPPGSGGARP